MQPGATQPGDGWGTRGVSVRYGDRLALDHVTFWARPGQVSAVVGGDGAGRTTLLRCLSGAVAASGGTVVRPPQIQTGYLAGGSGTYPDLTVDENLAFRAAAYRVPAAVTGPRVRDYLERAGLGRGTVWPGTCPAGCARSWVSSPRCCTHRPCWSSTSRPPGWTRSAGPTCGR